MEKEIILLDFDDTLFSKTKFKENINRYLVEICDESYENLLEIMEKYIGCLKQTDDFRLDEYIPYLEKKYDKKIDLENFTSDKLGFYSRSLFNDTIPVLNELKNYSIMGIYSKGFNDVQENKIESSGIKKFLNEDFIYIDKDKLNPNYLLKLPSDSIIVDDKPEVIEKLVIEKNKGNNRFDIVFINRKNDRKMEGATTIKNLYELVKFVKTRKQAIVS